MLKKIVSLVVGATLVLATLGVAAADVATVSTYNTVNNKIAVETTVSNANAGEVYTYLAYKLGEGGSLETLTNSEVVYVDEREIATGETGTKFTYTTDAANDQAVVVLGNPAGGTPIDGGKIEGRVYYEYTVAVGEGEAAAATLDVTGLDSAAIVDIPVAGIGSSIVESVTVNGVAVESFIATNAGIKVPLSALSDGAVIVVNVSSGAVQTAVTILDGSYIPVDQAAAVDELPYSSVLALAKIEGAADEYGITFGPEYTNTGVYVAKAYAQGTDGLYAIRLYGFEEMDEEHKIDNGVAVWARAYAEVDGETIYSEQACRIGLDEVAAE